jgi:hypothetical protein
MAKSRIIRAALICVALMAGFTAWVGWAVVDAYQPIARYQPQVGDVLIQAITPCGRLLSTVKGVTQSKWCHCGVVTRKNGRWVVCEAVGDGVRHTPLIIFLLRGDEIDFAAYRLTGESRAYATQMAACCETYVGRPYDIQYELDDEKIYCSELVYKAYRDAADGGDLAAVQRFGDLNWRQFKDDIAHFHGDDDLPLDRKVVTPVALTRSPRLEKTFELHAAVRWQWTRALVTWLGMLAG